MDEMIEKPYDTLPSYSPDSGSGMFGEGVEVKPTFRQRIWDSFKRNPNSYATPKAAHAGSNAFDVETAAQATADTRLLRRLKGRHLQMIAIGGSIGRRNAI